MLTQWALYYSLNLAQECKGNKIVARITIIAIAGIALFAGALGLLYAISRQEAEEVVTAGPSSGPSEAAQIAAGQNRAPMEIAPTFDVVRVNPNGDTVVAGRATPGAKVLLMDNNQPIGEVEADEKGGWVLLPQGALTPGEHRLSLRAEMKNAGSVESNKIVTILVPQPAKDISGRPSAQTAEALALETPKSGDGASRLLNGAPKKEGGQELSLDIIDYTVGGSAIFSGRARPLGKIFLYMNDKFLKSADADEKGAWHIETDQALAPGTYRLRIDQVGEEQKKVIARLEMPFEQADFAKNIQAGGRMVVQPGNSLWRLARRSYGEGTRYTILFEANKDRVKDPDLIYPGQVLNVPATQ